MSNQNLDQIALDGSSQNDMNDAINNRQVRFSVKDAHSEHTRNDDVAPSGPQTQSEFPIELMKQQRQEEELKNHTASLSFFTKPIQRQKWGDIQLKPHTNWGDIFFDLFYVAAAYNLGNLLRFEPTRRGLLYFAGCFGPIQMLWFNKMRYDARFFTREDVWHQTYEIAVLIVLSTVVLHIRPVSILSNPTDHIDMFVFTLCLVLAQILALGRHVEIICGVEGEEGAKISARNEVRHEIIPMIFFVAAMIVSAVKYYGSNHHEASEAEAITTTTTKTDIPIWLCLGGSLASIVWILLLVVVFFPKGGNHKRMTVPMNIDYSIHRYGEWIMLMLGEGVLSLLIVDISNVPGYFVTFFGGIISLTLMEYLHFRSQPHHPDYHAMRRSKEAGVTFSIIMLVYSGTLIVLGASYKMFLYDFAYQSEGEGGHRRRFLFPLLSKVLHARELAGGGGGDAVLSDKEERRQRVANLFCGSLALAWLCSDMLILTHRGININLRRCQCESSKKIKAVAVVLILMRLLLIVFIATVSQYDTNPETVSLWGTAGILAQVVLRVVGGFVFPDEHEGEDGNERKWPNVTEAQSEPFELDEAQIKVDPK